jgi:hypothetical protein
MGQRYHEASHDVSALDARRTLYVNLRGHKMRKLSVVLCVMAAFPVAAMAKGENNIGNCGWGSKIFDGQSGVAPQVLAVTTNGTFGNQTFGITSGTSGCTQDGAVKSNWRTALFIDGNRDQLARDMAIGSGETLDSLAHLLGVEAQDRAAFNRVTKDNMGRIFSSENMQTAQIIASLREVLAAERALSRYTVAL